MNKKPNMLKSQLQVIQLEQIQNIMEDLTSSEYRVFEALVSFVRTNKDTPTFEELGNILGMSKQAISQFVQKLEAKGYVRRVGRFKIRLTFKDADIAIENIGKMRPALEELKKLLDDGLISEEVHNLKVKEIMKIKDQSPTS